MGSEPDLLATSKDFCFQKIAMTVMERPYRVGDPVRIERCPPFAVPDELPPGAEVTVTGSHPGTTEVRDAAGREWRVSMCCVTAGKLYQVGIERRWRPADDPQVCAELARMLAMERARLDDCDASQRVVLERTCAGLEAQLQQ